MEFLICVAFIAVYAWAALRTTRKRRDEIQASFEILGFPTPQGERSGREMRVVKELRDNIQVNGEDVAMCVYRYCVGPGPSYFVAIGQFTGIGFGRRRLDWALRPLSAERMRGALFGDEDALAAAFGDVVHDRLSA